MLLRLWSMSPGESKFASAPAGEERSRWPDALRRVLSADGWLCGPVVAAAVMAADVDGACKGDLPVCWAARRAAGDWTLRGGIGEEKWR
jgi:hypothetical protein